MKKIISVFMCLCMVLSTFTFVGFSASADTNSGAAGEGITWSLEGDVMTLSGYGYVYAGDWSDEQRLATKSIVISEGIEGITVSSFYNFTSLESVTLADSVITVDYNAFFGATALKTITIGKNYSFGLGGIFNDYPSLETVNISAENNVYKVVDGVVYSYDMEDIEFYPPAKKDKTFTIPDTVADIYASAFQGNKYLESVVIPDSVECIYENAFNGCTALSSLTGGKNVNYVGGNTIDNTAYYNDTSNWENGILYVFNTLYKADNNKISKDVVVKNGTVKINDSAFEYCTNLETLVLPDSLIEIDYCAFLNCTSLKSVDFGEGVEMFGQWVFENCTSLESIELPASVEEFDAQVFMSCNSLTSVTVSKNNKYFSSVDGVVFNKDKSVLVYYPTGKTHKSYTIPNTVVKIDGEAFYANTTLEEVVIGDSVEIIDICAFDGCSALETITLGKNIKSIESYAFSDTAYYKNADNWKNDGLYIGDYFIEANYEYTGEFVIKEGTVLIASSAFEYCEHITDISIPDSVKHINVCDISDTALYNDESKWENGALYIDNHLILVKPETTGEFIVKSGTKTIADYAFADCDITKVTIPNSVVFIGIYAFSFCTELESVVIPDSVEYIGRSAFEYCYKVKSIKLSNNITKIHESTFYSCYNLESIEIPKSVESIEEDAFSNCYSLVEIIIPEGVVSIGKKAFEHSSNIVSITLPSTLESIGDYAFSGTGGTEKVKLPNNIKYIGEGAFDKNTKIFANPGTATFDLIKSSGVEFECNHKYKEKVLKNPTCTANGLKSFTCACGDSYTKSISQLGHRAKWVVTKKATHFAKGKKVYKCDCGEVFKTKTTAKLTFTKSKSNLKVAKKSIKIKYKKVKYATGFRVRYKTAKGKWKYITFKAKKNATKIIKNLKSGKKYKVQVQAMRKVKGQKALYSNWTAIRTVKVK